LDKCEQKSGVTLYGSSVILVGGEA